jgi:hypothetical protein
MAAAIITVCVAFVGYLATYLNGLRLTQRQERLSRVNRQLSDFYGPLLALVESNRQIFEAFAAFHRRPDGTSPFGGGGSATDLELVEYRLWFGTVFLPNIRRMRDIVVDHADLLIEESMPPVLLKLCAHVSGYEITTTRWDRGDYSQHLSVVAYPEDVWEYARTSFAKLKHEQATLLGHRSRR